VRSEREGGWVNTIEGVIHDWPRPPFPLGNYTRRGDLEGRVTAQTGIWEYQPIPHADIIVDVLKDEGGVVVLGRWMGPA
jgi:hypothetical protein